MHQRDQHLVGAVWCTAGPFKSVPAISCALTLSMSLAGKKDPAAQTFLSLFLFLADVPA